jgi:hypothetical protein
LQKGLLESPIKEALLKRLVRAVQVPIFVNWASFLLGRRAVKEDDTAEVSSALEFGHVFVFKYLQNVLNILLVGLLKALLEEHQEILALLDFEFAGIFVQVGPRLH